MTDTPTTPTAKKIDRRLVAAAAALLLVGFFAGQAGGPGIFTPKKQRPVLTLLAKVAKAGLWLLVVEPVPDDLPDEHTYARLDSNTINHREGW